MTVEARRHIAAIIFDVDGVLLASPHERAWREALTGFGDPARFTTALYQVEVAGKPRLDGARATLKALGVVDGDARAEAYAQAKQTRLEALIDAGAVKAFPDALRFVADVSKFGWPLAVASSSKNAEAMLRRIQLPSGRSLHDAFVGDVCGHDVPHGKPASDLFLLAARTLAIPPERCLVIEDAPAGIAAARAGAMAGAMAALGVARLQDAESLNTAGADLVVTGLDAVSRPALARGTLRLASSTDEDL
ncbi:HAD family hydrolase [Brevundimonas sp. SL130]|uniref:HAD family hydrolase n=1 Tax=Brevundimonas sp. SL130 TaxID=2995143 RepID=UPI00226D3CE6|nr:HAD-IA family hydrolase [Brevundimonas sp. SL130]WAC59081.1 HAD-IA family hydrolase [Brevundimonas sp. SL130]